VYQILVENGVSGLVSRGSDGEALCLSWEERRMVIEVVIGEASGRVLVIYETVSLGTG